MNYSMKDLMLAIQVTTLSIAKEAEHDAIIAYASSDATQRKIRAECCLEHLKLLRDEIDRNLEDAKLAIDRVAA